MQAIFDIAFIYHCGGGLQDVASESAIHLNCLPSSASEKIPVGCSLIPSVARRTAVQDKGVGERNVPETTEPDSELSRVASLMDDRLDLIVPETNDTGDVPSWAPGSH